MFDQFLYIRWEYAAQPDRPMARKPISALAIEPARLSASLEGQFVCVLHRERQSVVSESRCPDCDLPLEPVIYLYAMDARPPMPLVAGEVAITNPPLIDYQGFLVGATMAPPAEPPKQPDPKPKRVRKPKVATEPAVVLAETDAPTAVINYPS